MFELFFASSVDFLDSLLVFDIPDDDNLLDRFFGVFVLGFGCGEIACMRLRVLLYSFFNSK